jgi:flagellar motor switch protein FliG
MLVKSSLPGRQKAAILLAALGPELASELLKRMPEREIEKLTAEILSLRAVKPEQREMILDEFVATAAAYAEVVEGGVDLARDLLSRSLGERRAMEILEKLIALPQGSPFEFIKDADAGYLLNFVRDEHPQTIALVLAHLDPEQAAQILGQFEAELQIDVAKRIATMDRTPPDVIREVERVLEGKLESVFAGDLANVGGVKSLVSILNRVDRQVERKILMALAEDSPEVAETAKNMMFVFEDLLTLDDRSIQQVLREVDSADLALALKGASEQVRDVLFRNLSKKAAETLREDIEFLGPVRLRHVEEAQRKIVEVIKRLEESGEIVLARPGEEEMID